MEVVSEIEVLKIVCQRLNQVAIPYMLTGSLAANFYVVPRMTRDIDIVIELSYSEKAQILQIFQEDFYVSEDAINEAIDYKLAFNIIHQHSILKADFIVRKDSAYRILEFQRKRQIYIDQTPIWIVSPEDLILSKLSWAKDSLSEMQLKDVSNLLKNTSGLDQVYLEKWVEELNLIKPYEMVKADA